MLRIAEALPCLRLSLPLPPPTVLGSAQEPTHTEATVTPPRADAALSAVEERSGQAEMLPREGDHRSQTLP